MPFGPVTRTNIPDSSRLIVPLMLSTVVSSSVASLTYVIAPPRSVSMIRVRRGSVVSTLLFAPLNVALVLIALGLFPDQEPALYLTAVVLLVVLDASFLLGLAFSFGRPATA
jgi:hypothetical protein